MSKVIMVFLDGIGIGESDSSKNPFFQKRYKFLIDIFGKNPSLDNQFLTSEDKFLFPTDANMGIDDLPQSGTGQTSIFCGINAPKINKKHFGPFPPKSSVPYVKNNNIFADLKKQGKKFSFANAYPQLFFDYVNSGKQRLSVTTLSCISNDIYLNKYEDLLEGKALSAEIDNKRWIEKLDYDLPLISPEIAAERLLKISSLNDFTLFEFFHSDHLGHWRLKDEFEHITNNLDRFLFYILKNMNEEVTLLICSDHGNFEDISVKSHTRNPAMTISAGKYSELLSHKIKYLYDIKSALLEIINL